MSTKIQVSRGSFSAHIACTGTDSGLAAKNGSLARDHSLQQPPSF
jgi:hypothetical protein